MNAKLERQRKGVNEKKQVQSCSQTTESGLESPSFSSPFLLSSLLASMTFVLMPPGIISGQGHLLFMLLKDQQSSRSAHQTYFTVNVTDNQLERAFFTPIAGSVCSATR